VELAICHILPAGCQCLGGMRQPACQMISNDRNNGPGQTFGGLGSASPSFCLKPKRIAKLPDCCMVQSGKQGSAEVFVA
jgi:hypothetical protein